MNVLPAHTRHPIGLLALLMVLLSSACGGGNDGEGAGGSATPSAPAGGLQAAVASYDLAVGPPSRFIVGVFDPGRGAVGYGSVELAFSFLGEQGASGTPQPGPTATAGYLPLPGSQPPPAGADRAQFLSAGERGVYGAQVAFDRAGFWQVEVTADLDPTQSATAAFQVLPDHEVPVPGEPAPRSENLTIDSAGAPPAAIDSRAGEDTPVPDPELHRTTVAEALAAGRPVLLVISTPTYCVSQFCGPITQMVAELEGQYGDRAAFIHIEVWRDFEANQLNDAAREWIARGRNINEPWVFLIGGDGTIRARWDNVASRGEIEPLLADLPVLDN